MREVYRELTLLSAESRSVDEGSNYCTVLIDARSKGILRDDCEERHHTRKDPLPSNAIQPRKKENRHSLLSDM